MSSSAAIVPRPPRPSPGHPAGLRRCRRLRLVAAVAAAGLFSCTSGPGPAGDRAAANATTPPLESALTAGRSVDGRPISGMVFGVGRPAVLVLATIHGNEAAGTPLLAELAAHLRREPAILRNRRVILIPVANPDGLARGSRENARGVDLNRNFPAGNFRESSGAGDAPLSEPESQALKRLLDEERPDRIVSLHQPLTCIDYDGPALDLATVVAREARLPLKKLGGRPGSLGSYAGITLGIPIVTVELPRAADRLAAGDLWRRYGALLLAAIAFPDPVPARAETSVA